VGRVFRISALIFALGGAAGCGGDRYAANGSASYVSKAGNFRVAFPERPKSTRQTVDSPAGKLVVHLESIERARTVRLVSWTENPHELIRGKDPEGVLDGGVRGMTSSGQWTIRGQHSIPLGPHPGREVQFEASPSGGGPTGRGLARIYLVGDRLYQVLMIGPESATTDRTLMEFVGSFELIDEAPVLVQSQPAPEPASVAERPADQPEQPPLTNAEPSLAGSPPSPDSPRDARPKRRPRPGAGAAESLSGGASISALEWISDSEDVVGKNGPDAGKPDGEKDQHLKVEINLPDDATIENVIVIVPNSINRWETRPSQRYWGVAVFEDGEAITLTQRDRLGVFSGKHVFDLFVNGGFALRPEAQFDVELMLSIAGEPHKIKSSCVRP
jgi:hypothetical protein